MKTRILLFLKHYLPGYRTGGPVRSISNMVDHLGDLFHFKIVTLDRDAQSALPYQDIKPNEWNRVGKADVYYTSPDAMTFGNVLKLMKETSHDVIYLNSFFNPKFTIMPLIVRFRLMGLEKPLVLAPRGEFSTGALNLKRWKKMVYIAFVKALGLYNGITWQASSVHEEKDIQRFFRQRIGKFMVAPNLPPLTVESGHKRIDAKRNLEENECLKAVFLSRIAPMKNLDFALRVLSRVNTPVNFSIYGPIWEKGYWAQCQDLIANLPQHVNVRYCGEVFPEQVYDVFADHDVFLFPTRGENFGHVILEALSAGAPVIISDKTPWKKDKEGACTVLPLIEKHFVKSLELLAAKSPRERNLIHRAAKNYAEKAVGNQKVINANINLFNSAIQT